MIKKARVIIIYVSIIAGLFLIQSLLTIHVIKLNLMLLPIYYIGLRKGEILGLTSGALIGTFEDGFSGTILGPAILSKGFVGILSSYLPGRIFIWSPLLGVISMFLLTITDEAIVFLSLTFFSKQPATLQDFIAMSLIRAAVNSPVGGFIKPYNE